MAKHKQPGEIIKYWAPRLGLDPRAVKVVAGGEGGLEWGRIGDGGHAFGPFQQNDAGGVLTGRFGSSAGRAAFANSEPGMVEAMRAMAKAGARGQSGMQAVSTIISKYERPKDIPGSIAKAGQRWKAWGMGNSVDQSTPASPAFGYDDKVGGLDAQRRAAADFFRSRAKARLSGGEVPGIGNFASTMRSLRQEEPPSTARPQGQQINNGPGGMPFVLQAGNYAQSLGLSVRENPYYDKVDPVHTEGSDHYRTAGTYRGKPYGAALDVSGDPEKQKRFFTWLEANRGRGLDDMFSDPQGYSYDEGKRWNKTIGGHGKHVHASFK